MKILNDIHGWIVSGLALLSGVTLALFTVGICADVVVRSLGFQPPAYTVSLVEYGLLYVTMLSAPWLLRQKGHVYVDMVTRALPPAVRRANELLVYILAAGVCFVLAYAAFDLARDAYVRGDLDTRDFDMPRWLIFSPISLCFLLLALEFLRFLFGNESLYEETGAREQL